MVSPMEVMPSPGGPARFMLFSPKILPPKWPGSHIIRLTLAEFRHSFAQNYFLKCIMRNDGLPPGLTPPDPLV